MTIEARELLMMANRSIHNKTVSKLLAENKVVVTDRSFFSGMVYAQLNGMGVDDWYRLYQLADIEQMPKVIIFVRNKKRNIDKEVDNIYDHASDETLSRIDRIYEHCLLQIKRGGHDMFQDITVVEHENSFDLTVEENLYALFNNLKQANLIL